MITFRKAVVFLMPLFLVSASYASRESEESMIFDGEIRETSSYASGESGDSMISDGKIGETSSSIHEGIWPTFGSRMPMNVESFEGQETSMHQGRLLKGSDLGQEHELFFPQKDLTLMRSEERPGQESSLSHTIRISAQATSPQVKEILGYCALLLPDDTRVPFNLEEIEKGRIPICSSFSVDSRPVISLTIVGGGPYEGCSEKVLFGTRRSAILSTKDLFAVRLNVEGRTFRQSHDEQYHSFVRVTGRVKRKNRPPVYKVITFDQYTHLAPSKTFGNDFEILDPILKRFVYQSNLNRESTYVNVEDDSSGSDDEYGAMAFRGLAPEQTYAISSYIIDALDKYGEATSEDFSHSVSLFIHHGIINRLKAKDMALFLKDRYSFRKDPE